MITLGRLLPHARGLGFKPHRGGFPSGAKKEWGLSPKAKGDSNLKTKFPRIYALECAKNISVADKMLSTNLDNTLRRRPRSGIEQQQYLHLIAHVSDVNLINMNDRWIWSKEGSGEFSVASARRLIDDQRTSIVSTKTRWVTVVSIKINVFVWKMKLDRLLMR
nr:RNA-directed DNA polymerase, eukaryota [Tanacetum cinerariifolium]